METIKTTLPHAYKEVRHFTGLNPITAYLKFTDSQKDKRTLWWFVNLMVHGNLVLAIPATLIYYYNAPVIILGVTVSLFFANLVVNMCGCNIRVTLTTFFVSLFTNISMVLFFIF
ncbi:hypothetical protein [Mucilaginibacter pocheonensis]|uniref:PRA1 family protein n=1 Tax=Mucilaginibacter pocheonensis TaxID=398050 RepID=A0ABU1TED5_9SPHI|nr:hypothetical protein [Mucilaginibacter pocheonensis]MDR6943765.1 hypothetical protein [Mucilaginibacter pocheonensis]